MQLVKHMCFLLPSAISHYACHLVRDILYRRDIFWKYSKVLAKCNLTKHITLIIKTLMIHILNQQLKNNPIEIYIVHISWICSFIQFCSAPISDHANCITPGLTDTKRKLCQNAKSKKKIPISQVISNRKVKWQNQKLKYLVD